MTPQVKDLEIARARVLESLRDMNEALRVLYTNHPSLLPKNPSEMSVADKLRFSGDLLEFIECQEQYRDDSN